jgi:hypothetical protein
MKKKIINLVAVGVLIILLASATNAQVIVEKSKTKNADDSRTNDDIFVDLTLHVFKDKNDNGEQDADETNAEVNGFKVEILSPFGNRITKTVVEGTGSATFQVLEGSSWSLYGYEKIDWLLNDQWKGSKGVSLNGIEINSDITYNIPLEFEEKKIKIFNNPLNNLLDHFPLIKQLLSLWC